MLQVNCTTPYKHKKRHKATMESMWKELLKIGHSNPSPEGVVLSYYLTRLEKEGRAYRLEAHPGYGYGLTLITHIRDAR